jgi:hypothetical protein
MLKGMNGTRILKMVEKLKLKGNRSMIQPIIRRLSQVLDGVKKRGKGLQELQKHNLCEGGTGNFLPSTELALQEEGMFH